MAEKIIVVDVERKEIVVVVSARPKVIVAGTRERPEEIAVGVRPKVKRNCRRCEPVEEEKREVPSILQPPIMQETGVANPKFSHVVQSMTKQIDTRK